MTCQQLLHSDSYSLTYSTHPTRVHCHRKTSKCNVVTIYTKTSLKQNIIKAQWGLVDPWGWEPAGAPHGGGGRGTHQSEKPNTPAGKQGRLGTARGSPSPAHWAPPRGQRCAHRAGPQLANW